LVSFKVFVASTTSNRGERFFMNPDFQLRDACTSARWCLSTSTVDHRARGSR
jgi:hypothetical protein